MSIVHVTVGPADARFPGYTHASIQAAVNHVVGLGGGTIEILPGVYCMGNAVHLKDNVHIVGHGEETRLVKPASAMTPLVDDTDWYGWSTTVKDPSIFEVGGGLLLKSKDSHSGKENVTKHTITAIDGNALILGTQPRENHWITHEAKAATLFPVVTANWATNISIKDLLIDGNRKENEFLDGNYGGCIFLQDCNEVMIDGVHAVNNNGDGISWQVCNDVTVQNCVSSGHAGLGLHPGSGSQRPVIRDNVMTDCDIGLFWCWGVQHGLAENNEIRNCQSGISIGHRDSDNVMRNNRILGSGKVGLIFRPDSKDMPARAPHRTLVESNHFEDAGTDEHPGVGIDIHAPAENVTIRSNRFVNTDAGNLQTGFLVRSGAIEPHLEDNTFENITTEIEIE